MVEKRGEKVSIKPSQIKNLLMKARAFKMPEDYFFKRPQKKLHLNYAMIRFVTAKIGNEAYGFKTIENDPRAFFNASYIKEKKELHIHMRTPVRDEWNKLSDYVDIDIYMPENEIKKLNELVES